ncbi:hypothetical protein PHLGIDRAFT_364632 [Phlebiopsis gigantea 11061_1 CR5-6]|uniref:Uncharacterized protein n=1 Tax=Phlebiopsis gigantea (strain 11061_1 CR5-6) TaxID=745531 RepID=A0A0C3NTN0_PHLG1|nr:hypothetical protein PHLGIDRAFT_364632 [Phlebiopsis gigantea 11061_1 CR5-6]
MRNFRRVGRTGSPTRPPVTRKYSSYRPMFACPNAPSSASPSQRSSTKRSGDSSAQDRFSRCRPTHKLKHPNLVQCLPGLYHLTQTPPSRLLLYTYNIAIMCQAECFGNYHRRCNHYVKQYESGIVKDCNSPHCALSKAHCHTTEYAKRRCTCNKTYTEDRRVLNMIQDWCDDCRAAAWASLDPDNSRQW